MIDKRPNYSRPRTGKLPVVVSDVQPKDTGVVWIKNTTVGGKPVSEVRIFDNGEWTSLYETPVGDFNADFNKDFCY